MTEAEIERMSPLAIMQAVMIAKYKAGDADGAVEVAAMCAPYRRATKLFCRDRPGDGWQVQQDKKASTPDTKFAQPRKRVKPAVASPSSRLPRLRTPRANDRNRFAETFGGHVPAVRGHWPILR